jgi:ribosomal protein L27
MKLKETKSKDINGKDVTIFQANVGEVQFNKQVKADSDYTLKDFVKEVKSHPQFNEVALNQKS